MIDDVTAGRMTLRAPLWDDLTPLYPEYAKYEVPRDQRPLWDGHPIPYGKWFLRRVPGEPWRIDGWLWLLVPPSLHDVQDGFVCRVFRDGPGGPGSGYRTALAWMRGERA